MEILNGQDYGKVKRIECTKVMREDERLAQPNVGAVQFKQPEFRQYVPCHDGKNLSQPFASQQPFLTFPIQSRRQLREREIGCHKTGAGIGKQTIDAIRTLFNMITLDECARIDVVERH